MTTDKTLSSSRVLQITITRLDGPLGECNIMHVCTGWEQARMIIARMAQTAPRSVGDPNPHPADAYDKIEFCARWMNGEEYKGRLRLNRDSDGDLASIIRRDVIATAGQGYDDDSPCRARKIATARIMRSRCDLSGHDAPQGFKLPAGG